MKFDVIGFSSLIDYIPLCGFCNREYKDSAVYDGVHHHRDLKPDDEGVRIAKEKLLKKQKEDKNMAR